MYWLALAIGLLLGGPGEAVVWLSDVTAPAAATASKPSVEQGAGVHKSEGTVPIPPT